MWTKFCYFKTPDGAHSGYDYSNTIVIDTSKLSSNILSQAAFLENFFYHLAHHKHWKYNLDVDNSVKFELQEGSRFATEMMKKAS